MLRQLWKFVFAILLVPSLLSAQGNLNINWIHSWGGSGTDIGGSVATDSIGDVYVAGSTTSFGAGGQDVLLLKYDPSGNLLWAKTWGGASNDVAYGVLVDQSGAAYVVGGTESFGAGWYDALILKFDSSGNLLWARTWGGGSFDMGYDLSFDQSGNIAIAAESYSYGNAVVLLKLTPAGDFVSATTWKGPATYDSGYSIAVDAGGNSIITGISWDYGVNPEHNTILVVKFDSQGNLLWNRNWAGPGEDESNGRKTVRTDAQGNIYIAGRTCAKASSCDFNALLLKIDPNGNLIWSREWGGVGDDAANSLWIDSSHNLDVVGSTKSIASSQIQTSLVQQYDSNGNLLTSQTLIPLVPQDPSELLSIAASPAGGLVASGDILGQGGLAGFGLWQNTGLAASIAAGSLSAPTGNVGSPTGSFGTPQGTLGTPIGIVDVWGNGGSNTLTESFSLGGAPVIVQPPGPPTTQNGQSLIGQSDSTTSKEAQSAEPISTGSGNYYYAHSDFDIASVGIPLIFERFYNSLDDFSGPLGSNWNHAYDVLLGQTSAGVATIRWGDGHGEAYTLTNGVYVPQPGVYNSLVANQDGTFTLAKKDRTQYNFSAAGKLTSVVDKNGNTTALTYDASGNLVTITATGGRSLTLAYDANGRITSVTDPMGRSESYAYDDADDLVSATDPLGGVTKYAYDSAHHVTQITLPNGNILLQNAYDSQGRVTAQTNGRGYTWQFAYNIPSASQTTITDANGNKTVHTYDGSLRIVGIADALGHMTSYAYDSNNDRTSVTNQNGNTTTFAYDANGNLTSVTDPLSNATAFTYDAQNDLLTATNPKAKTTAFTYDAHGNLTAIQDALGGKTTMVYDSLGELTGRTDAKGNTTTFSYSGTGDLSGIKDALGNTTSLGYDGDGRLVSVMDPNLHIATSTYDALGRLIKVADPLGDQTVFSYDAVGNLLSVTDANGHATNYGYDATNNLVTVTDALGYVTKYAYDPDNNRTAFTNANSNTTTYQYDALNRLTKTVDPLSFATTYGYDSVGNVVTVTDAKRQTNRFAYDVLNRLLSIAYADGKNVAYSYDADGNRTSMIDWTGTTAYTYDDLDRLTSVTFPGNKNVAYSYDADDRRASLTYPDGKAVGYGYDADERLSTVTDWLSHLTQYAYDAAGNLGSVQYPNKVAIDYIYDAANRLTSVVNKTVGILPLAFYYTLDPAGNRTTVTAGGIPTSYGYDALNELTSARTWFLKSTWTYDAVGNRVRQTLPIGVTNYTYDAADRLLKAGTRIFTYDADGNQTSVSDAFRHWQRTYTWNAANRLVSVDNGRTDSFVYDGDGNRVSQTAHGWTQNYVNDVAAALPVVLQDGPALGPSSDYVYGLNLIESAHGRDNDFYQYDGLGSVVQLTDAAGRPELSYFYDAWGNSILPAPPENSFRFAGQALDAATGLYFMRARYYDPSTGRFMSKDSLATANRYAYAEENPLLKIDPTGLFSISEFGSMWNATGVAESGLLLSGITYAQGVLQTSGLIASTLGGPAAKSVANTVNNYVSTVQQGAALQLVQQTSALEGVPLSIPEVAAATRQVVAVTDFSSAAIGLATAPAHWADTIDAGLKNGTAIIPILTSIEGGLEDVTSFETVKHLLFPQNTAPDLTPQSAVPEK